MLTLIRPHASHRYLALPVLGGVIDRFTTWSAQQGFALGTIRNQLKHARQIDAFMGRLGVTDPGQLTRNELNATWEHYHHNSPAIAGTVRQFTRFLKSIYCWEPPSPPPTTVISTIVDRYADHLRGVRGLCSTTIHSHCRTVHEFLNQIGLADHDDALDALRSSQIDDFLCCCAKRLNRYTIQHEVAHLRGFLRFQFEQGALTRPLHTMIDTVRVYRLEQLPRSLPWETVKELLDSIDCSSAYGLRDYTIFFLIATYGLRACEIAALSLDDIDWRTHTLLITQRKTARQLLLPLTDDVAAALIEYLRRARPSSPWRQLFLRVRAPSGPLKPTAVTEAFQLRAKLSGLPIPFHGAHCLRHSCAVNLLRRGVSTKSIGDLLGHRSAESTTVYLRLATEDLRGVALEAPQIQPDEQPAMMTTMGRRGGARTETIPQGALQSGLAGQIQSYLDLMRSLGRRYTLEAWTLGDLDAFLAETNPQADGVTAEIFRVWQNRLRHLSATVRRSRMLHVRRFCLYCRRRQAQAFVPDLQTFPQNDPKPIPCIVSAGRMARVIEAARGLPVGNHNPLRGATMALALMLLYTCGLRRGELLRLRLENYDALQRTLRIEATKFHKSRIIPLSISVANEMVAYLSARRRAALPMSAESALIWNGRVGPEGRSYTPEGLHGTWKILCAEQGVTTNDGRIPRLHDLRHSFAIEVLQHWNQQGLDVQARLPLLATYMGHASIASTHYYLTFTPAIAGAASEQFHRAFGAVLAARSSAAAALNARLGGAS